MTAQTTTADDNKGRSFINQLLGMFNPSAQGGGGGLNIGTLILGLLFPPLLPFILFGGMGRQAQAAPAPSGAPQQNLASTSSGRFIIDYGHNDLRDGEVKVGAKTPGLEKGDPDYLDEAMFADKVGPELVTRLRAQGYEVVESRGAGEVHTGSLRDRMSDLNIGPNDIVISLHFNAMPPGNEGVNHPEILYSGPKSKAFAQTMGQSLSGLLGESDLDERGNLDILNEIRDREATGIILEPAFVTNPTGLAQLRQIYNDPSTYVAGIVNGVNTHMAMAQTPKPATTLSSLTP
jgi:N-acetylmuramoyl-L-alanine amidase